MDQRRLNPKLKKVLSVTLWVLFAYLTLHMLYIFIFTRDRAPEIHDLAYVHFIDVGQGEATLIQGKDFNMLIDAGENPEVILAYLEKEAIEKLDYVVATHPHSDHIGAMDEIIYKYPIDNFLMPNAVHTTDAFDDMLTALELNDINVSAPTPGDTFGNGDIMFTVLGPRGGNYPDLNNYSICLKLQCGEVAYLFTGDAEALAEEEMINSGADISATVYQVSHHGSTTSSTDKFLEKVHPEYAVISSGAKNDYGHPHMEVLDKLEALGAKVYRTDVQGNIVIFTDGKKVTVLTNY